MTDDEPLDDLPVEGAAGDPEPEKPQLTMKSAYVRLVTPGSIGVDATCPLCGAIYVMFLTVDTELRIEGHEERTLRLRVKASKPTSHVCSHPGQETLDEALEKVAAEEEAPVEPEVPDPCPWPGCYLPADHLGDHQTVVDDKPGAES